MKHHLANARSKVGATPTAQLVWILAPRLPEPERVARTDEFALEMVLTGVESRVRDSTA